MKHQRVKRMGFTIVEVLVSLSIFTMVVTISVGSLLILIHANARTQNAQLIMTNLTFALDSMTREIRTGVAWQCRSGANFPTISSDDPPSGDSGNCIDLNNPGTSLSIVESSGRLTENDGDSQRITYFYKDGRIWRKVGNDGSGSSNWVPLTSSEVAITDMQFVVTGTSNADEEQPKATIVIKGEIGNQAVPDRYKKFTIQTTISQNVLDI